MGAQCFSSNMAKFSIALLQPTVSSLTGVPSECVLYKVLFLAGLDSKLTTNFEHSSQISCLSCHLDAQLETIYIYILVSWLEWLS